MSRRSVERRTARQDKGKARWTSSTPRNEKARPGASRSDLGRGTIEIILEPSRHPQQGTPRKA